MRKLSDLGKSSGTQAIGEGGEVSDINRVELRGRAPACKDKSRFVPDAGRRDVCQKLSPMRTCSGSFAARIVVRLCGYCFAMHPGCSVSCTGVDRFGWFAHWDGLYRYTTDEGFDGKQARNQKHLR